MAFRTTELDRNDRSERWDRERFDYERSRSRSRFGERERSRERFEEDDERVYTRRVVSRPPPPRGRSPTRSPPPRSPDRFERRPPPRSAYDDDDIVFRERERRRVVYDDDPPLVRRRPSPPATEVQRRVVIEKERVRESSPSPVRPPRIIRRQSSLDTFDRRPSGVDVHVEYGPPSRREEYRIPPYVDVPLPRHKALPPPRVYAEREYYDEFDDDFHHRHPPPPPERIREREIIRTRTRSRDSRVSRRSRRGRSRSSSRSSSSSSSGGTTLTRASEYPKKGKTRIPARLVSKRALMDLGYPFMEEGSTIVVQKALGQKNIDDLLKLSEDYKKSELEIMAARSSAGDIIEERRTTTEIVEVPVSMPMPMRPPSTHGGANPIIVAAHPPSSPQIEVVKTTVVRDHSPARSYTTSYDTATSYDTTITSSTSTAGPLVVEARPRGEFSDKVPVGPLALVEHHHRHSSGRESDEIRSEIRALERQLARRERHERHGSRELVRAERLSTGELVVYEEEVERLEEPSRGGVRVERDRRGRMSISVPRYR